LDGSNSTLITSTMSHLLSRSRFELEHTLELQQPQAL
jgi:hypothetical protein